MVYGSANVATWKFLWEHIVHLSKTIKLPWAVMGDFNSVMYKHEKIGSSFFHSTVATDFMKATEEAGLIGSPVSGRHFTFFRDLLQERLDRVLINNEWVLNHRKWIVSHLA